MSHDTCAWSHHTLSHHTHTAVGADRVASVPPVGTSTRLRAASAPDRLSAMCGACHSMCTGLMSLHCCMRAPWCARHHGGGACACAGALPPAHSAALQMPSRGSMARSMTAFTVTSLAQQLLAEIGAHTDQRHTAAADGEKASMRSQCAPSGTEHRTSFPKSVSPPQVPKSPLVEGLKRVF